MNLKAFAVGASVVVVGLLLRGPVQLDPKEREPAVEPAPIRVEVLNGSGVNRAGQRLAERLRELGFDVVDIRNADRPDYPETLVLDRVGNPAYARSVADALGVAETTGEPAPELLLEVTVILGRDQAPRFGGSG